MNRVPWVLRVVWDPIETLDLVDGEGRPDHSKILPALCLIWLLVLVSTGKAPDWYVMVILISASYGYASWRSFLKSRMVTRTESRQETVTRLIPANEPDCKRDDERGQLE